MENEKSESWFKKHADTAVTLGSILATFIWMHGELMSISNRLNNVEKDITMIRTVLILKNIVPNEMCKKDEMEVKK